MNNESKSVYVDMKIEFYYLNREYLTLRNRRKKESIVAWKLTATSTAFCFQGYLLCRTVSLSRNKIGERRCQFLNAWISGSCNPEYLRVGVRPWRRRFWKWALKVGLIRANWNLMYHLVRKLSLPTSFIKRNFWTKIFNDDKNLLRSPGGVIKIDVSYFRNLTDRTSSPTVALLSKKKQAFFFWRFCSFSM